MTTPAVPAPGAPTPLTSVTPDKATLSRELADFLIEFSIALHKTAIYPAGHPLLETAVEGIARRLSVLLSDMRPTLSIGVARRQLIIEGVATDANHPLLRELAARLHRHHLGAVKFTYGITRDELSDMLGLVALEADRQKLPLGLQGHEVLAQWDHARLFPLTFEQLELLDEEDDDTPEEGASPTAKSGGARAAQLWIGLARAALAVESEKADEPPPSTDPVVVAKAIDEHGKDTAYDQVVVGYLLQIADELKAKQGKENQALQKRISRLVETLQPETLERLLTMGGDVAQRVRFVLDSTAGMAVDAVVDIVKAAAASGEHQNISNSMVRLLSKFAAHAELGAEAARPQADEALREHTRRLIGEWSLTDPNPDSYREALEGMARATPLFAGIDVFPAEADRMIAMALEIGIVGDAVWRAVDDQLRRGRLRAMLDMIESAPDGWGKEALWARVATQDYLYVLLSERPLDVDTIRRVANRMGMAAVSPLLDTLEGFGDKLVPPPLLDLIGERGIDAAYEILDRLPAARWATQRQLLAVLGRMNEWPKGFSPTAYLQHADADVRREALRMMLRQPALREDAICAGVTDPDEKIVRMALSAAVNACPFAALQPVMSRADDAGLPPDLRALAVRVMASCKVEVVQDWLVKRALGRKRVFRRRLAEKSPEMLAALAGLAAYWNDAPEATPVLELAMRSSDPEIRAVVATRRGVGRLSVAMVAIPDEEPK